MFPAFRVVPNERSAAPVCAGTRRFYESDLFKKEKSTAVNAHAAQNKLLIGCEIKSRKKIDAGPKHVTQKEVVSRFQTKMVLFMTE